MEDASLKAVELKTLPDIGPVLEMLLVSLYGKPVPVVVLVQEDNTTHHMTNVDAEVALFMVSGFVDHIRALGDGVLRHTLPH